MTFTETLEGLENRSPMPGCAGTSICRVLMDNGILQGMGVDTFSSEYSLVWCLSLGSYGCPKIMFYGHTIEDTIKLAHEHFALPDTEDTDENLDECAEDPQNSI